MAKWVTFYWSIMNGTVDLVEHKDKETAREYFLNHYKKYFEYFDLNTDMKKIANYRHRTDIRIEDFM